MKNYTVFGMLILHLAADRNMSVTDIAKQTKISYPHLSNMLRGEKNVTPESLKKICSSLKLNRQERSKLREAAFISSKIIKIDNDGSIPYYTLRMIYFLLRKKNTLSKADIDQCKQILSRKTANDYSE